MPYVYISTTLVFFHYPALADPPLSDITWKRYPSVLKLFFPSTSPLFYFVSSDSSSEPKWFMYRPRELIPSSFFFLGAAMVEKHKPLCFLSGLLLFFPPTPPFGVSSSDHETTSTFGSRSYTPNFENTFSPPVLKLKQAAPGRPSFCPLAAPSIHSQMPPRPTKLGPFSVLF